MRGPQKLLPRLSRWCRKFFVPHWRERSVLYIPIPCCIFEWLRFERLWHWDANGTSKRGERATSHAWTKPEPTNAAFAESMSRLQNFKCCPPIIMMNSYRFYWQGSHPSLLSNNVSTRSLFGPFLFEDTTIMMKDYEPPILFAICMAYALFAVDNLEFYEQKKFQRR